MLNKFPDVMNVEEMCKALNIGVSYAYKLLNSGEIQGFRAGKIWKINKESVIEFIRRERIPRPEPMPVAAPAPPPMPLNPWQEMYAVQRANTYMTQPYTYMAPAQQSFVDEMARLKNQANSTAPTGTQPVKRKRGRPRKHPLPDQQSATK